MQVRLPDVFTRGLRLRSPGSSQSAKQSPQRQSPRRMKQGSACLGRTTSRYLHDAMLHTAHTGWGSLTAVVAPLSTHDKSGGLLFPRRLNSWGWTSAPCTAPLLQHEWLPALRTNCTVPFGKSAVLPLWLGYLHPHAACARWTGGAPPWGLAPCTQQELPKWGICTHGCLPYYTITMAWRMGARPAHCLPHKPQAQPHTAAGSQLFTRRHKTTHSATEHE